MKGEEVPLLFSRAKTLKNPYFLMKYMKNESNKPTFAVAASKKIFKTAVERNKVRRRIYSAVKAAKMETLPYSIVFMPNREAIDAPYRTLVTAVETICKTLKKS
jgi:ribonuclease P protein component